MNEKCKCGCFVFAEDKNHTTDNQDSLFLKCESCETPINEVYARPKIKTSWYAIDAFGAHAKCEECGRKLTVKDDQDVCEDCLCPEMIR